jgi:hypothetical protein
MTTGQAVRLARHIGRVNASSRLTPREREVVSLVALGLTNPTDRGQAGHRPQDRRDACQQHARQAREGTFSGQLSGTFFVDSQQQVHVE